MARATLIIDSFDSPHEVLSLIDVMERTGLPSSSSHRIVTQLVDSDWIVRLRCGYRLGPRALSLLVNPRSSHRELRAASSRHLHSLMLRTGMVVRLTILDGADELILDQLSGRWSATPSTTVGDRNCPCATVSGRTLLSVLSPEALTQLLHTRERRCAGCGAAHARLESDLANIRRNDGILAARVGHDPGSAPHVAAVVDVTGVPVAAVSLGGRAGNPEIRHTVLVADAACAITAHLEASGARRRAAHAAGE
ncbi:helix-turn-helix domain-containing protein [Prescottella defluvii]|uniref:IclR family transcriptional regulator n=1 Tax=Prescottella defluvii TaxID=1323361 RepID=UPI00068CA1EC|nr:helix-turn-helix domain-containing protein [Prescottella defluvii]